MASERDYIIEQAQKIGNIEGHIAALHRKADETTDKIDGLSSEMRGYFAGLKCKEQGEKINDVYKWWAEHSDNKRAIRLGIIRTIAASISGGIAAVLGIKFL